MSAGASYRVPGNWFLEQHLLSWVIACAFGLAAATAAAVDGLFSEHLAGCHEPVRRYALAMTKYNGYPVSAQDSNSTITAEIDADFEGSNLHSATVSSQTTHALGLDGRHPKQIFEIRYIRSQLCQLRVEVGELSRLLRGRHRAEARIAVRLLAWNSGHVDVTRGEEDARDFGTLAGDGCTKKRS
ncbi:hypothetical protein IWX49DRAFT_552193 [Phyllosticta citricarpa]|uniref:Uncharacterized protein n=1 Tax=Phyllosticta citricarpa TaxID=55181 RepID=A0ABR1ML54_9PEZI